MRQANTQRQPYSKLPSLDLASPFGRQSGQSLLKSMRDYQGFWKPTDLKKDSRKTARKSLDRRDRTAPQAGNSDA